jgi:hypothetical protein
MYACMYVCAVCMYVCMSDVCMLYVCMYVCAVCGMYVCMYACIYDVCCMMCVWLCMYVFRTYASEVLHAVQVILYCIGLCSVCVALRC